MGNILSNIWKVVHQIVSEAHFVTRLIIYFNILLWLLPPLKQFKGGYFIYFIILAITDPIAQLIYILFKINPNYLYAPSSAVLLLSALYYINKPKRKIIISYFTFLTIITTIILLFRNIKLEMILMIFIHISVCLFFIYRFMEKYFNRNILYVYLLVLIFYEFTVVMKLFVYLFDIQSGLTFLYSTDFLEFFICFYFIFFNFKNGGKIHYNI
jgi:hypothetical protein